ncbi:hypothetical protein NL676_010781 [Syzygium grande]|nr:hypothetical protein NL676_010781 [Syzygium grande]
MARPGRNSVCRPGSSRSRLPGTRDRRAARSISPDGAVRPAAFTSRNPLSSSGHETAPESGERNPERGEREEALGGGLHRLSALSRMVSSRSRRPTSAGFAFWLR